MAATKSTSELKALQQRVAEMEKQLHDLRSQLNGSQRQKSWQHRPMTEEEQIAYHEASKRVTEYIRKERERDRKRVNAAIDSQIEKEKKAATRQQKVKVAGKARKAG
jgi:hypothetical protein